MEIEKEIKRIIEGGAEFCFGVNGCELIGFGEIYRPNVFLYAVALFYNDFHLHEIRFDRVELENERCVLFVTDGKDFRLVGTDPQERDCSDVEEWMTARDKYLQSWLEEKERRLSYD
jgi:hypothetical protein